MYVNEQNNEEANSDEHVKKVNGRNRYLINLMVNTLFRSVEESNPEYNPTCTNPTLSMPGKVDKMPI